MNWQSRLEKAVIAVNLIGLGLGFGTLGILILVKGERGGESWISGILGIVVGSLFLLFAFYFCKQTWGAVAHLVRESFRMLLSGSAFDAAGERLDKIAAGKSEGHHGR
jgi:hypothetical protein